MSNSEEIAAALSRAREITKANHGSIIRSQQLVRRDRELLCRTKWLQEIIKGWYLLIKPDIAPGDSSAWYASFWDFLRIYLGYHFGKAYCLSAENSLDIHTGSTIIPKQVIVISTKGGGAIQNLPYDTSLLIYKDPNNLPEERVEVGGLQVMSLPYALCKVSPLYFQKNPKDAEIALQLIRPLSEVTQILLKYNFKSAGTRLIGAYEFLGNTQAMEELQNDLLASGWKIKGENPFINNEPILGSMRIQSPYVARILSEWKEYREKVISSFPPPLVDMPKNPEAFLSELEDIYERDAYNSLSIEGYQVNEELIARVQNNEWNPENHPSDLQERNALAARGYYEAFLEVKKSLLLLLMKNNPGDVIERDLKKWYQSLFSPSTRAGIIRSQDLIGYRTGQVYIRNSRHVPLPKEALVDSMETLFACLRKEEHPAVRAVLGHYFFVYIHPYMDGNGRIGRFLMNAMLVSGGYPWAIVEVKNRNRYLQALEIAGVEKDIEPFARFIAGQLLPRN